MPYRECLMCGLAACDLPDAVDWTEDMLDEFFQHGLCRGCDDDD